MLNFRNIFNISPILYDAIICYWRKTYGTRYPNKTLNLRNESILTQYISQIDRFIRLYGLYEDSEVK